MDKNLMDQVKRIYPDIPNCNGVHPHPYMSGSDLSEIKFFKKSARVLAIEYKVSEGLIYTSFIM